MSDGKRTRRAFLRVGGVAVATLAGCTKTGSDTSHGNETEADAATNSTAGTVAGSTTDTATESTETTSSASTYQADTTCPMFNYDHQNTGGTSGQNAPSEGVSKQWRMGGVTDYTSPVVADGTVYITTGDIGRKKALKALDLSSGEVQWTANAGCGTPVVTSKMLFAGGLGKTRAFSLDGEKVWQTGFHASGGIIPRTYDLTLFKDTLYFTTEGKNARAIDATDGTHLWKANLQKLGGGRGQALSSVAVSEETVFVSTRAAVLALNRADGSKRWTVSKGSAVNNSSASVPPGTNSSPTLVNDTVYVGGHDGVVRALDASSGTERWSFQAGGQVNSSPAVVDGTVYVGSRDSNVYAIDAESGEVEWKHATSWVVDSHPTVADGVVFVMNSNSKLYALNASDGKQLWRFKFDDTWAYTSPAVADGTVLFTTAHGSLYALA